MDSPSTFGEWLRRQRNDLRLTREEFARCVGCSVALLRKIEDGERRPSVQIAELIANCLDIPPDHRSTFVKVARGELRLDRLPLASSPVAAPAVPRINLPVLPTPLIGRQRELLELSHLLRDPQCRLLTLTGPGGIGKTRLAIEAASRAQAAFAGGVYFVPLTSVNSARFIVPMIADAIGFTFQSAAPADPKTQLFSYLKEKRALLLVDNLEHLLSEPGIEVLAELLASALLVKLLATSRESLGLQGEWVFEVQGLQVPESIATEGSAQDTSVELFLQRARRAHVGFNADPQDYPAIIRICRLVDGMPLGIELAAAWVRALSCDEIAQEIERGLDFLSVSARDLPARHRSMRAVFDHSWKLLTEEEQAILRRLSVFQGGFDRQAAEAVASAAFPALSALLTKSLLHRSASGRYDLHELIRKFAAGQFDCCPDEHAATQARHASYYLAYFSQAGERLRSPAQRQTLTQLTAEMDNFRLAWDWALARGDYSLIDSTLRTFALFYDIRGWFQEGFDMLDRAVTSLQTKYSLPPAGLPENRADQVALGHLLACQGLLAFRLARYEQAQALLERSIEIVRPLNEPRVLVESITFLGFVMGMTGQHARSLELYAQGQELATAVGDRWFAALCYLSSIDMAGFVVGSVTPEETHARFQTAVADLRLIGDPRITAIGLNALSLSALMVGRYDEARLALEESVALSSSVGDRWGLGFAYRGLGIIAQSQGEHQGAIDLFRKSLDTLTDLGATNDVARVLAEMSYSVFALGDHAEAGRLWRQALRLALETGGGFVAMEALAGLVRLQAAQGDIEHALQLLFFVMDNPATTQYTRDHVAPLRPELEAQLPPQQVAAARQRAQSSTLESIAAAFL